MNKQHKFKGKIPLLKRTLKTPQGKATLLVANIEWSSNDKKTAKQVGDSIKAMLDGIIPAP